MKKIPKTGSLGKVVPQLQEELGYHTGHAAEKKGETQMLSTKVLKLIVNCWVWGFNISLLDGE